jgi:hypothetical protein
MIGFVWLCFLPIKIIKISIIPCYYWINAILPILTLALFFQIDSQMQRYIGAKALSKTMCAGAAIQCKL